MITVFQDERVPHCQESCPENKKKKKKKKKKKDTQRICAIRSISQTMQELKTFV